MRKGRVGFSAVLLPTSREKTSSTGTIFHSPGVHALDPSLDLRFPLFPKAPVKTGPQFVDDPG
jgi:hypothetical protein